jgi:uncharacterized surface protein with fasciclin (FAS1) repeats
MTHTVRNIAQRARIAVALLGALVIGTPAALAAQDKDIVATAVAAGSFKTLATALTVAGLVETLQGPGPFTVFAPTDEAFAKVPKAQLDALLADKEALKAVLLYHVVPGRVHAADAVKLDGKSAKMVSGDEAKISVMGGTVMVNQAHVTTADVMASNGVIHIIDAVILPPAR